MPARAHNQNSYSHGKWNALCDVCGFKFKSSDLKERWDGLFVCKEDWEQRHPLDFERGTKEDTSVPWARPEGEDISVSPPTPYFINFTVEIL